MNTDTIPLKPDFGPVFKRFVNDINIVCKAINWPLELRKPVAADGTEDDYCKILVVIGGMEYQLNQAEPDPKELTEGGYFLSIWVTHYRGYMEPPDSDEAILTKEDVRRPESLISKLLDIHWSHIKQCALESTFGPMEGEEE